jgi:hypothetical protein
VAVVNSSWEITGIGSFSQTGQGGENLFQRSGITASFCTGAATALNNALWGNGSGCGTIQANVFTPASGSGVGHIYGLFQECCGNDSTGVTSTIPLSVSGLFNNTGTVNGTEQWAAIASSQFTYGAGTLTRNGGLFATGLNAATQTVTNNYGLDAQTGTAAGSNTNTTDATIHVESPTLGAGSTLTHHYGVYIEDQTVAGSGTNSDPHGFYEVGNAPNAFQGHLNQIAAGNWAGTCTMSTTTCTVTLSTAYTTPGCVATVQGTTPIAAACSVSSTTVTITAASSNTATWGVFVFGNPN